MDCYSIVKTTDINDLVNVINQLISEGWEPLGGVGISGQNFIQAVINRSKMDQQIIIGQNKGVVFPHLNLR